MRTAKEIVAQTNDLARSIYALAGYEVSVDYKFQDATHPQEKLAWLSACHAQQALTDTDVDDALSELEE